MKYCLLIIVINLFAGFADAQKPGARLIAMGLKGKVKQVIEYKYSSDEGIGAPENPEKSIINFDEKGNQLDETIYFKVGLIKKTFFSYTKGKITQRQYYNKKLNGTYIQTYDENGHEIEFDMSSDGDTSIKIPKSKSKFVIKYDNKGNRIEEDGYFNGTTLTNKTIFIYNKENQVVEEDRVRYSSIGVKKEKCINKYDSKGYIIRSETYDLLGKLKDEYAVSYSNFDKQGNWLVVAFVMKMYSDKQDNSLSKDITKREIVYFK
jgi:hypothetical protein